MLRLDDAIRAKEPAYFSRKAVEAAYENNSVDLMGKFKLWVVTDCRQKSDLNYFKVNFPQRVKTIRIVADDAIREQRGWSFISGLF